MTLTRADIDQLQATLRDLQAQLSAALDGDTADAPVALDQQLQGRVSRIDAIQQQEMAKAAAQQNQQLLRRVNAALQRIDDGEYGECLDCGEPIALPRLQAQPYAALCLHCQVGREG